MNINSLNALTNIEPTNPPKQNVLQQTREILRRLHYSIYTERAYCDWISRYVRFHHAKSKVALLNHPEQKVEAFFNAFGCVGECGGFDAKSSV